MVTTDWLKKTELFQTLDESQLNTLLSHSHADTFPQGEIIFTQGDEATRLFILIEGAVDLTVKTGEKIDFMTSKIEREGAVFGMPSMVAPYRYNVTATCLKPSKVLTFEADRLKKEMENDTKMGMEIMKRLATLYFNRLNEMRLGVSNLLKVFKLKTT